MFDVDPTSLADSRIQLHLAAQLIGGAADASLEKATDDSHANMGWNAETSSLEGRAGVSIRVEDLSVHYAGDAFDLEGAKLEDATRWLSEKIDAKVVFRGYDGMPKHAIENGTPISIPTEHRTAMAAWFSFAQEALAGNGELRIWPHHFDMGFWQPSPTQGKSIGGGFSIGDDYYDRPYFYMNPYGLERPDSLPSLPAGHWTKHWFGAVLDATELQNQASPQQVARQFVTDGRSTCETLLK